MYIPLTPNNKTNQANKNPYQAKNNYQQQYDPNSNNYKRQQQKFQKLFQQTCYIPPNQQNEQTTKNLQQGKQQKIKFQYSEKFNELILSNDEIKDSINGIKSQIDNIIITSQNNSIKNQLKNINRMLNMIIEDIKKINEKIKNLFVNYKNDEININNNKTNKNIISLNYIINNKEKNCAL